MIYGEVIGPLASFVMGLHARLDIFNFLLYHRLYSGVIHLKFNSIVNYVGQHI